MVSWNRLVRLATCTVTVHGGQPSSCTYRTASSSQDGQVCQQGCVTAMDVAGKRMVGQTQSGLQPQHCLPWLYHVFLCSVLLCLVHLAWLWHGYPFFLVAAGVKSPSSLHPAASSVRRAGFDEQPAQVAGVQLVRPGYEWLSCSWRRRVPSQHALLQLGNLRAEEAELVIEASTGPLV
jgi:hypothetical protein